jgi:hypothetical protein
MTAGSAVTRISALLDDYMRPLGMRVENGPLRAMRELTRGIVFTGSVQLSNAARLFVQSPNQLHKAVERMGFYLASPAWDHRDWADAVLAEQVRQIDSESLIPIDPTDLAKPYARAMQYQDTIRDASRVGDPLVHGYWCWGAYHWQAKENGLSALMLEPYSPRLPGFRSENDLWDDYCRKLQKATGGKGIWLHDRGADRPEVLASWLLLHDRWIIRLREDRALIGPDGSLRPAGVWADVALATRPERGNAVTLPVYLPPQQVHQPEPLKKLWLVVPTYRFASGERWVLLTRGLIETHHGPRQLRHAYAVRWRGEDGKRFLSQIWHVERFLTCPFLSLQRMLWCVVLASGFLPVLQQEAPDLREELESEVLYWRKRNKPVIPAYRMARGIQALSVRQGEVAMLVNA